MNHRAIINHTKDYRFISVDSLIIGQTYKEILIEEEWSGVQDNSVNCLIIAKDNQNLLVYLLDDFPTTTKGLEIIKKFTIQQVVEGNYDIESEDFSDEALMVYDRYIYIDNIKALVNDYYVGLIGFINTEDGNQSGNTEDTRQNP